MLSDSKIKSLTFEKTRKRKHSDARGLFIYLGRNNSKLWRQKYRYQGKEKVLSHGIYPSVSLSMAREFRDLALSELAQGNDPSIVKRSRKVTTSNTFEKVARRWHENQKGVWSERYQHKVLISLESDIFPVLGNLPIDEITTPMLLSALSRIEKRGSYEQARRVTQRCDSVYKFAIASGIATYNPAQDVQGAIKKSVKTNYAFIKANELPEFLEAFNGVVSHPIVKLATEMLMLTFVRTGELISAEWHEIDFEKNIWEIPASKMKRDRDHLVPLSTRVIEILEEVKKYNHNHQYVFASPNKPRNPLSNNAILQLLKRMGYQGKMTGHGFRHLASTTLNELGYNRDAIENQLAHVDSSTRGVYNKAELLSERIKMMDEWSVYLAGIDCKASN
ncbi:MAG: integrase [Arenicella sp.]|jgi:integrase